MIYVIDVNIHDFNRKDTEIKHLPQKQTISCSGWLLIAAFIPLFLCKSFFNVAYRMTIRNYSGVAVCKIWLWQAPNGELKDISCRDMLRQLDKAGRIRLLAPLSASRLGGGC